MTPIIYTYGSGQYLNSLFESLSMLFDFGKHSEILWLGRISALLGVIWMALSGFASRGKDGSPGAIDWTWFLRFAMIWIILIVPKTDMEIHDKITKATYKVTGAPWSISIFGWFTSSLGYGLTRMYEDVLGGGMNAATAYSGNGVAFGSSYYNELPKIARFEGNSMQKAITPFISECLIPAVGPINTTFSGLTKDQIFNAPDYHAAIQGLTNNYLGNRYVYVDGISVTCLTLRDQVLAQWDTDGATLLKNINLTNSEVVELDSSYIGKATDASSNSLKQAMMINAMQDSAQAMAVQYGDAALADSLTQAQAQYQQSSAWRQGSQLAAVSLVWLHIVAECLTYAIFPLLIFLILLPVGFNILMEYLKILFWLQTWPILYAVLNSIVAVFATTKSQQLSLQYGGFTMSDFYKIGDLNDGVVSTAGYVSTLVPVLSWMFLQRAGMAIASAVGSFTMAGNNTAESAGKQEALGSMDINRVSVRNSDTAGSSTSGSEMHVNRTSTGSSTTIGNETTVASRAGDNKLPVSMNFGEKAQESVSNRTQTVSQEASQQAKSWSNVAQTLHNAQTATSGGISTSTGTGGDSANSLKKGETLAAEAAAKASVVGSASAGIKILGNGATVQGSMGVSGGISSKASQDYAQAVKAYDDWKQSATAGLTGSVSDAVSSSSGLTQSSSKTASEGVSVSRDQAIINSKESTLQTDGTNAFKEWMMHEKGMSAEQINNMAYNNVGQLNKLAEEFSPKFVNDVLGKESIGHASAPNVSASRGRISSMAASQRSNISSNNSAQSIIDSANSINAERGSSLRAKTDAAISNFKEHPTNVTGENIAKVGHNVPGVNEAKSIIKNIKEVNAYPPSDSHHPL